jgi:hypothetical protein
VVADTAELHLVFELVVAEALSRDGILHWVCNNSLLFTSSGVILQCDNTAREAAGELLGVCTENGLLDVDGWQKTVRSSGDRRELGVVGSNALDAVALQVDSLSGSQFCDQDVGVDGANDIVAGEVLGLLALRVELELMCVDGAVDIQLVGVALSISCEFLAFLTPFASDVELQDDGVVVARNGSVGVDDFAGLLEDVLLSRIVLGRALLEPLHPAETLTGASEGNETDTVTEYLVLDDGSVVVDEDVFYGQSRDLGQHNTAVCVCDRGVDADERKDRVVLVIFVEVYMKFLEDGQRGTRSDSE